MSKNLLESLALPALSGDKAPQFTTLASCKEWVSALAITNAPQAQLRLRYQLDSFNCYALANDPSASVRLSILDHLRAPARFVQEECAKHFCGRMQHGQRFTWPLPTAEQTIFDAGQALWQALETGYLQILRLLLERAAQTPLSDAERHDAARAARCILSSARSAYLDHVHAGLLPGASFWQRLHRTFMLAESLEVLLLAVDNKPSVAATYVEVLLLAAVPLHRLTSRQAEQVVYWAQRWALKVPLLREPPDDLRTPPLCVDLAGQQAARYGVSASGSTQSNLRWLDLRELRKTIKSRLGRLAEGATPEELKLGKHCAPPDCEKLLQQVYRDWCKGGRAARSVSGTPVQPCSLVSGIAAIHHFMGGRRTQATSASLYLSQRTHEEIATFGHVARHAAEDHRTALDYVVEDWQIDDEDLREIELHRPLDTPSAALRVGQLVVVHLAHQQTSGENKKDLQLAQINWLLADLGTSRLCVQIHLLPGVPQAINLVRAAAPGLKSQHAQGFCLPSIPPLDQPATLLAPPGWFDTDRVIEIHDDELRREVWRVRLTQRLERGADFERCAYDEIK
jgi:hypothetical protein